MTALLLPTRTRPKSLNGPVPLTWSVAEFHQLGEEGKLEGRGAMLIDGVILEHGPMNAPHAVAGEKSEDAIRKVFPSGWRVRSQKPLVLGKDTDPEPDVAVVRGQPSTVGGHPTTADLVLEIADSSLRFDTTEKKSLYASAGIEDYWVLDLNSRTLLVFRNPVADGSATYGATYRDEIAMDAMDIVRPLALPTAMIAVVDLLP